MYMYMCVAALLHRHSHVTVSLPIAKRPELFSDLEDTSLTLHVTLTKLSRLIAHHQQEELYCWFGGPLKTKSSKHMYMHSYPNGNKCVTLLYCCWLA
jgi:hypothetical protein